MREDQLSSSSTSAPPAVPAATFVLTVAYDGAPFCGFARQEGHPTVQGELERALRTLLGRDAQTVCAGRTDAGVHALGQVVSLPISADEQEDFSQRNPGKLLRSLNALTADGISVRDVSMRDSNFSARFDAKAREYRYRICTGAVPPVTLAHWAWWLPAPELDANAMQEASRCLIGEHDFKSFCVARSGDGKSTCRNLHSIDFSREEHLGEECLTMRVVGNAFLHNMIRILVGTLAEVGRGHRDAEWVSHVLDARDRRAAGPTAPPQGLTFWSVQY